YLTRLVIRPRFKSYGDSSTRTLSPGTTRMKFIRILPLICASTEWPFWSSTLNIAFGRASETVPSTSMTSLWLGLLAIFSRHRLTRGTGPREVKVYQDRAVGGNSLHAATAAPSPRAVSTTGPPAVQASVCSKWAERLWSAVTTVQRSARVRVSGPPMFTIGSMAMQRPSLMGGLGWPLVGRQFGTCGSS